MKGYDTMNALKMKNEARQIIMNLPCPGCHKKAIMTDHAAQPIWLTIGQRGNHGSIEITCPNCGRKSPWPSIYCDDWPNATGEIWHRPDAIIESMRLFNEHSKII